ncbi:MAG: HEAT repeat domain-containing protein, partial [Desulfamplus sp.]|nr:HEAT repeat domain-containing protein [Desulfamplus sp.]
ILFTIFSAVKNFATIQNTSILSAIVSGIITISLALLILYSIYPLSLTFKYNMATEKTMDIKTMLEDSNYKIRVEGLKKICNQKNTYTKKNTDKARSKSTDDDKETIWNYPEVILNSMEGSIAEKYWLANAFATAKNPDALPYLEQLSTDISINVQCAAVEAIGIIGITQYKWTWPALATPNNENEIVHFHGKDNKHIVKNQISTISLNKPHIVSQNINKTVSIEIIDLLQKQIINSSEWYVQKSAYNALRNIRKI